MAEESPRERRERIRRRQEEELARKAAERAEWLAGHPDRAALLDLHLASELFTAEDGYGSIRVHTNEEAVDILLSSDWLAAHDAQVKAEAWDEGETAGVANQQAWGGWRYAKGFPLPNPYRAAETEATR